MTPRELTEKLKSQFGGSLLEGKSEGVIQPYVKVAPETVKDIALFLRDDSDMAFDSLMCLSGIDYGKNVLGVVYHLCSTVKRHKIVVKVDVPADKPNVSSVADVWPTAGWHEREAYDMYGITFAGHPDLRRMLLPEDYPGHPLRKDFKVPEFYQGMKVPY